MSQSLKALLWTPLVTIWKPLAVAVWSSTGDRSSEGSIQGFPDHSQHPHHPNTLDPRWSMQKAVCKTDHMN